MNNRKFDDDDVSGLSAGGFFRWEARDQKIAVYVQLNAVQLLERDTLLCDGKIAAGVLLGYIEQGEELTLTVEDYDAATPDHGAVDSPLGNNRLLTEMEDRVRRSKRSMSIVGFYRTSGGAGAAIDEGDLMALAAKLSTNGNSVSSEPIHLRCNMGKSLIFNQFTQQTLSTTQASKDSPGSTARNAGTVCNMGKSLIFSQFNQQVLSTTLAISKDTPGSTAGNAGMAKQADGKDSLPREKSIESRASDTLSTIQSPYGDSPRILLLIENKPDQTLKCVLFVARNGEVECQWQPVPLDRAELSRVKVTAKLVLQDCTSSASANAVTVTDEQPSQTPTGQDAAIAKQRADSFEKPSARTFGQWLHSHWALKTAMLAVAVAAFIYFGGAARLVSAFSPADSSGDPHLELKAERHGSDWTVTWDNKSPALRKAAFGAVAIHDGFIRKELHLEISELRSGRIIYSPVTDNFTVQLKIVGSDLKESATETVRILAGVLPPLDPLEFDIDDSSAIRSIKPKEQQRVSNLNSH